MTVDRPRVSIALVTHNGAATLPALLDAIAEQEVEFEVETVAVDSSSSDGSNELLHRRVDRVVTIAERDFDHGLTRNLAIDSSTGELVVLLVQDAIPASPQWLRELVGPFATDELLAGTFARQLPRPDASRITRMALARWVAASTEPRTCALPEAASLADLAPSERHLLCAFDNVCSCIRRSVWKEHPFRAAVIAEDLEWAREVLLAGHRLRYVPAATVIHSHERPPAYELRRTVEVHRRLVELFELRTIPSLFHLLRAWAVTVRDHLRYLAGPGPDRPGLREIGRTMALAFTWPLGQYLGGRRGRRGGAA
jgi:rhamnosyltransferase